MQAPRERTYSSYSFLTSTLDGGEWSTSRPGRALPRGIWRSYRTHNKLLIVKQVVAAYSGHWALNRKGTWMHVCFFLCFGWNVTPSTSHISVEWGNSDKNDWYDLSVEYVWGTLVFWLCRGLWWNVVRKPAITRTNMVTVRSFEIRSDKFQAARICSC
jgi:hypothetical protein